MIIEKEKILWKPRNAGIAYGGSAYIGIYARGVNVPIFHLMKNICMMKQDRHCQVFAPTPHPATVCQPWSRTEGTMLRKPLYGLANRHKQPKQ
jgi:hypothetical protein